MDAVILAGGLNSGPLRHISEAYYEAEIEIAGRPMLDYVILALKNVAAINRIVVVGSEAMLSEEIKKSIDLAIKPGDSLIDSLLNGLDSLETDEPVLVLTSDIPLITREAVEDFLSRCQRRKGDVYYSFVSKELNEKKYPGVQRTYVKLKEGTFTGGNLVLLSPRFVKDNRDLLIKAASLRKKPLQLGRMLGWRCLYRFLLGKLTIPEIEERVAKIFNINAVGVVSPYPEVGIDVDKPSDLKLAKEVLSK
ncbi:MAG: NTP transferase domain-containing protein [Bacillota bacterium]